MLNDMTIKALEEKGFKRWTKGTMDRLYVNADKLGLDCCYNKSGRVLGATFNDEHVSNTHASEMLTAKTYIDVLTGEVHSIYAYTHAKCQTLLDAAQKILDEILAAHEPQPETTVETTVETTAETTAETTGQEEENKVNRDYEIKAKIVRAGASRVFNSWQRNAGITMDDFLAGLSWLCDDPRPDGKLTRELGCSGMIGAERTPEERMIWGEPQRPSDIGLHHLTRCYYQDGTFAGFRDENGQRWESNAYRASISALDRV